jgi:protein involved in polysaccharide export with SLBB domain
MNKSHRPTTRRTVTSLPGAIQLAVAWLVLGLASALLPTPVAAANSAYVPYVESLQSVQRRAYVTAAPSGQDEELAEPALPLELMANAPVEQEDSRLEQIAEAQNAPINLEETQQQQVLHSDLEQFGYDIFDRVPSTFAPVAGIPVPVDYRIGPGDNIIVQLFGKLNVEYKLVVTRDGNILVPEYGPVKVAGLTFDEAEQLITEGFERRVIGVKAVVAMGQLRTMQIRIAGDVVQPGAYTVGGLTTTIDALLASGGVRRTGSLRNIQLIRGGKSIQRLDLYDLLLRGHSDQDIYLAHNDTIFVPPIGSIVYVGGEVQRPAIYELNGEKTVGELIGMAGGLLPTASLEHSHIERIQTAGTRTLIDFSKQGTRPDKAAILGSAVQNGDLLRILPLEDELENVVLLSGHVKRPGGYQFRPGMRVSDVLPSVEMLLPGADVDFMLIKREQPATLRTEILYVDLIEALSNPDSSKDIALQSRDQLVVFNLANSREQAVADIVRELDVQTTDYRPARVVEARGAVRYNGRLPLQEGSRLLDVIALAGGLQPGTDLFYGVIARTSYPARDIEILSFNITAAMKDPAAAANPVIAPGDRLYFFDDRGNRSELLAQELDRLRQQASYGADERVVSVLGEVLRPGTYPLATGMRASDLLCAARGLTRKAYGLGAELSRVQRSLDADNTVEHTTLDSAALLTLCDLGRRSAAGKAIDPADQQAQLNYFDDQSNPELKPMDQLVFAEKSGWVERASVTLSGEMEHPGVYAIDRGETLCQVMERAGGLTEDAYGFGAQFTRVSVREMQQQTLDELHDQLDDLMVELSLSQGFQKDSKSPSEFGSKQDYMKTIRQLERAQATGRMVVDLEQMKKCGNKYDVALEDGDALTVPRTPDYVQVAGQVYVPTSHLYNDDRKIADYVELSGGQTLLGRLDNTYVIQANGEVLNYAGSRSSSKIARASVMPGAKIYVPLDVDRMNGTEKAQTWVDTLVRSAILAGIVL